jgi:hypothetical protein
MWKVVGLLCSRGFSLLELKKKNPHLGGQRLLRDELRRIAECSSHAG